MDITELFFGILAVMVFFIKIAIKQTPQEPPYRDDRYQKEYSDHNYPYDL